VQQEKDVPAPVQQQEEEEEEEEEKAVVVPGALRRKRSLSPVAPRERPALPLLSLELSVAETLLALGGPQFDLKTKPAVTPARSLTTTAGADLGVMTPRPSGQASTSGLVIPQASRHAGSQSTQQKPFRGSDTLERVNQTLVDQGFPEFDKMSNEEVIRHYGECSAEGHAMVVLLQDGVLDGMRATLGLAQRNAVVSGPNGCLDVAVCKITAKCWGTCPTCKKAPRFTAKRHRVVAMLNEPPENLWMAFVYLDKSSKRSRMFDASHRCCAATSNYCIRPEHVFLETTKTNGDRSQHQRGNEVCDHADLPCIGCKQIPT
jgi:hypothetical protein